MRVFNSIDEAKALVIAAQTKVGLPIDESGVRKTLVSLRALELIDWIEPKPADATPNDAESRRVKV